MGYLFLNKPPFIKSGLYSGIFKSQKNFRRYIKMADKTITCKDCSATFTFTESEQAFYKEKGFENEPQRCPDCRAARKQQRSNRGGNGGNRGFGGGNRW